MQSETCHSFKCDDEIFSLFWGVKTTLTFEKGDHRTLEIAKSETSGNYIREILINQTSVQHRTDYAISALFKFLQLSYIAKSFAVVRIW